MPKFLTIVAFVIGSIVIPFYIAFSDSKISKVEIQEISETNLVGVFSDVEGMELRINGKQITDATLHQLKFKNSGTVPIRSADFETPLTIKFTEEVYSAKFKNLKPDNLNLKSSVKISDVVINPFLFNPNDEFVIEIVSASQKSPAYDARIAGVNEFDKLRVSDRKKVKNIINTAVSFLLLMVYGFCLGSINFRKGYERVLYKLALSFLLSMSAAIILGNTSFEIEKIYILAMSLIPVLLGFVLGSWRSTRENDIL